MPAPCRYARKLGPRCLGCLGATGRSRRPPRAPRSSDRHGADHGHQGDGGEPVERAGSDRWSCA